MHFIYLQQSGKPVEGTSGIFWSLAGVAVPEDRWRSLQLRVNGLQKSFQKTNYVVGKTRLNANDLLHPRNAQRAWTIAYCKGLEKIAANLDLKLFLVVIDKRTTDKPAHPKWLLPLSYQYLMKPIGQYLKENNSLGSLVIPPGRTEEAQAISELQFSSVFSSQKNSPIVCSPLYQTEQESAGLQIADFVATIARRYHEHTYPKLFRKDVLEGYDSVINSHYQGFVKPHTYQSSETDSKGYRIRGYIYLWRRDSLIGRGGEQSGAERVADDTTPRYDPSSGDGGGKPSEYPRAVAEDRAPYGRPPSTPIARPYPTSE
jgi:hypothetical protein